ncbi:MAG: HD domain-containing protein [Planctomycetes bacterium]|nr:HD domain-containing protein [Planctomycetota bacterium]
MSSSVKTVSGKFIVDSIHGDIHLTEAEWKIIDTPSFQRLRRIKQLQMSQVTYPNATHTRFSHSLGTLGLMAKILDITEDLGLKNKEEPENLRLAALLHDVGHYPYSHLMETIDNVILAEDLISQSSGGKSVKKSLDTKQMNPYPGHTELGALIVTSHPDIIEAIGNKDRAKEVADFLTHSTTKSPQLSKLIASSLDLDRLDYLLRDSQATGVPFGHIDINYLLNNLKLSPSGMLGILKKAIPAVEQFLLARFFMHRCVYYHKTTYSLEEACKQLLRRVRDSDTCNYGLAVKGDDVKEIVKSADKLQEFDDSYIDNIVRKAVKDDKEVVRALAISIQSRKPPKLLKEVCVFSDKEDENHRGTIFHQNCKFQLEKLASDFEIPLGQFLYCAPKAIVLEKNINLRKISEVQDMTEDEKSAQLSEEEELIRVFSGNDEKEPKSLSEIEHSIINKCANQSFKIFRLYVVYDGNDRVEKIRQLETAVQRWE